MIIKDMFLKDINRDIRGVVKVQQRDEEIVYQELDEYVVTKELIKHFSRFYENYARSVDQPTDKMGVWISGFFGSGKSHFLKILSYLLNNQPVLGKKPVDFFEEKINDPMVYALMEKAASVEADTILFNIDAKSNTSYTSRDAILRVFKKVFDEHRGYYGDNTAISRMEKFLDDEGNFEAFKEKYEGLANESWVGNQSNFYFRGEEIIQSLAHASNMSVDGARNWYERVDQADDLTIESFAQEVKEFVDSKDNNFHLVFLVDEIGQYIGDNRSLMLNLQTVVESLGATSLGKVWVLVTSQESIDDVIKVKGDDFSRIQGRFDTRLSLSSTSADEVIKKRILDKKPAVTERLQAVYPEQGPILNNLISFRDTPGNYRGYNDGVEFAQDYPFVPYQFKLLQNIFEQVRKHGSSGKHLSEGERSLLSAYQEAAQQYGNEQEGALIPLYAFYNTMSEFLNPTITRVINSAANNPNLADDEFHLNLLKVLFMIKYIEEIPGNIDNIATLMLTNVNEDKTVLKQKLTESLNKLRQERLIQKNGENFIFLTDEEQDINREIQSISIDEMEIIQSLSEYLFEDVFPEKKFRFSNHYHFDFNEILDTVKHGRQTASINLSVLSAISSSDVEDQELQMDSMNSRDLIVRLGGDASYIEEMEEVLKIEKYRMRRNVNDLSETKQNILNNKQAEVRERRRRVRDLLEKAVKEADFYANGQKLTTNGSTARERINNGLSYLVENTYYKLSLVKDHINSERDLKLKITSNEGALSLEMDDSTYPNRAAMNEIEQYIELQTQMSKQITVKFIYDHFGAVPFGWKSLDISGMLVDLLKDEKIRLRYNTVYLNTQESHKELMDVFTNNIESAKGIILKREKVDSALISKVRRIARSLFDTVSLPQDEDGMMLGIQDLINDKISKINDYKQMYTNKKYPGFSLLEKGTQLFDQFNNRLDNLTYFNKLVEMEEQLIQWEEDFEYIKGFYGSNQKNLFDDGLEILNRYEENQSFFENEANETIDNSVRELEKIIKNPIPYSEIRKIPEFRDNFNETFDDILEERQNKAKERIQDDYNRMKQYSKQEGISDQTVEKINSTWTNYLSQIEGTSDIHRVDALTVYSNDAKEKYERTIQREVYAHYQNNNGNEDTSSTVVDPKPVQKVRITSLVKPARIENEQDIANYLNKLSRELKQRIQMHQIIEIID
ncbi:BREX system P-loop protein BrxC [Fundicoccus ignavus]|uniref:BREX system P-loop protein BrxC n=1 Tax=Fundicoccus ignavus TaxID=2664442 RepID=A0A844C9L3_9LACT|nr:BREX system P-loop protein BrxC [Fundicoccus ignavus]MRJ47473.1 BREX system P-loop protein BrxC [Fundicoccus ignavus]